MHFDKMLSEVVLPRPQFRGFCTTLGKALVVFSLSIVHIVNGFQMSVEVIAGSKTLSLARTPCETTFVFPLVSSVMFPGPVRGFLEHPSWRVLTSSPILSSQCIDTPHSIDPSCLHGGAHLGKLPQAECSLEVLDRRRTWPV